MVCNVGESSRWRVFGGHVHGLLPSLWGGGPAAIDSTRMLNAEKGPRIG